MRKTLYLLLLWFAAGREPPRAAAANSTAAFDKLYQPQDHILLNCGASGSDNDTIHRLWSGDINSKYAPSQISENLTAADQSSAQTVPYHTARVFAATLTYSFSVTPGRKFVRLYFYSTNYSYHSAADAFFSVTTSVGPSTLLDNFSAYDTALNQSDPYFILEFYINVTNNESNLDLTFTPSASHSGAYAFVNGIEIVSAPDFFSTPSPILVNSANFQTYSIDPNWALQTVYRLNVGGNAISPDQDSGLYRSWAVDSPYFRGADQGVTFTKEPGITIQYSSSVPMYIAPQNVYSTARAMGPDSNMNLKSNLSWIFPVDAGFYYLLRFHFCEIQHEINDTNERVFNIYIENLTADEGVDVFARSKGIGRPVYEDYVTSIPGTGFADLFVDLHPHTEYNPVYYDAILNGLEIFKLNNSHGSLAGLNPPLPPTPDAGSTKNSNNVSEKHKSKLPAIAGGSIGGIAFLLLVGVLLFVICRIGKKKKKETKRGNDTGTSNGRSSWLPDMLSRSSASRKTHTTRSSHASTLPSDLCRHFFFSEIESATENFDEARILGIGGFGKVYRGDIDGGTSNVAIKRGNPLSGQGIHEFLTEIELLSKLRHRHLVSLIGYCEENHEMVLVYDYMARGTLREHLYRSDNPPIPWRQRLEICIGAARGIHYLHTGAKYTVIHRDVKSTNILLDENWVAKVSDFGLSKTGSMLDQSHVSTAVKGSFGYLDPEYFRLQQLTEKSDVYSFGVVLFEVLCARPALNPTLPKEEVSLADWAVRCRKKGVLDQIIDPYLKGSIDANCFKKFAEIAEKCVADQGIERPAMGDVLWGLEFALQLQVSSEEREGVMGSSNGDASPLTNEIEDLSKYSGTSEISTTTSIGGRSIASDEAERLTPSAVFSQIMNVDGR